MATKAQLQDAVKALEEQLAALKAERDGLSREEKPKGLPVKEVNGVEVILRGHGMDGISLFQQAIDNGQFVTYGAVAEAIGALNPGEQFRNCGDMNHMDAVKEFMTETEVDHLVVNRQGKYGRKAPVENHHSALKAMGYKKMPEMAAKKGKKKSEKEELVAMLAKLLAD
jgi:alkylated DNA nucleotide flippase Atl1